MAGLLDIAPVNKSIKTSFGTVDVKGLTLNAIVYLVKKHPRLIDLIKNKGGNLTYDEIASLGLDVVASFIAAGTGYIDSEEAEKRAKEILPEDAFDLVEAILKESFPNGARSFFDKVTKAAQAIEVKTQTLEKP